MLTDRFSGLHSNVTPAAVAAYELAVEAVASHRPGAAEALAAALQEAPDMVAAHALKGFGAVLLARAETFPVARQSLALARKVSALRALTPSEEALLGALGHAAEGRLLAGCDILDQHLSNHPRDFVAIKLAHGMRFMSGDHAGMLATTTRSIDAWMPDMPAYGFVLGCHSFGLEEAGDLGPAERVGKLAVENEPRDVWGLHAVSHVYEMDGRARTGIALLDQARPMWTQCHNFAFHMAWHLALYHMANGRHDLALAVYDADVRPTQSDDFRDIANAVSVLWRLRQERVNVGGRWDELELIARRRATDTTLVFASLHHLLTLIATGDLAAAQDLASAMARRGRDDGADQAKVAASIGHDLAQVMIGLGDGAALRGDLVRLARDLPEIGGSHAQRDVFLRSLALIAAENSRPAEFEAVMGIRGRFRRDDRFAALARERLGIAQKKAGLRLAS